MIYKHTQIGHLMISVTIAIVILFGVVLIQTGLDYAILGYMLVILLILVSFSWLNVMIDEKYLRIKFGYGIFRKRFLLENIESAKAVRNHWYYGWGIRFWWMPRMWIFNVSGFGAVEIRMKSGKIYRIGTDEPEKLEYSINGLIMEKDNL